MPSLHFGWALLVAWGAVRFSKSPWRHVLIVHPFLTLAAIIITANHYWLDAAVALCIFYAALKIDRILSWRPRRGATLPVVPPAVDADPDRTDESIVAA
jgi:hypothetical protein